MEQGHYNPKIRAMKINDKNGPYGAVQWSASKHVLFALGVDPTARDAAGVPTYRICSIRRRSRIVAAPPDVLNEIVSALEYLPRLIFE